MRKIGFNEISWFRSRDTVEMIFLISSVLEIIIGSGFAIAGKLLWTIVFIGSDLITFILACIYDYKTS
jgi:hypothetical protein